MIRVEGETEVPCVYLPNKSLLPFNLKSNVFWQYIRGRPINVGEGGHERGLGMSEIEKEIRGKGK